MDARRKRKTIRKPPDSIAWSTAADVGLFARRRLTQGRRSDLPKANATAADSKPADEMSSVPPIGPYKKPASAVSIEAGTKATVPTTNIAAYSAIPTTASERIISVHWATLCTARSITLPTRFIQFVGMLPVQRITESHLISDRYILRVFYSDHYSWCQDICFRCWWGRSGRSTVLCNQCLMPCGRTP